MTFFPSAAARDSAWRELQDKVGGCQRCDLFSSRKQAVFGQGSRNTPLVFVGEAPGSDEDEQGAAFVGKAGRLLTKILASVSIDRESVFITNVVKCRPPENMVSTPEEAIACDHHLQTQIMLIDTALIILLGNTPARWILKTNEGITKIRGMWFNWRGIAVMPMFHPSYLLRNASTKEGSQKHLTWIDIREVKRAWDMVRETGNISHIKFG